MYKWKFFKSARCVQVKLENGEDLAALKELDQKLWTVLAASTDGLRFDPATLKLLDSDGDGRIRVPEVRAAVEWMRVRFKKLDFLFARKDAIALADINDETDEGKALLTSFKNILLRAGKAEAAEITLADVSGTTDVFNAQPFNGDGVVTPKSTSDAAVSDAVAAIVASEGGVPDRGGDMGADQAKADAFFADAAAYLAWKAAGKDAAVIGDGTAAGYAALQEVEAKIDEFFTVPEDLPLVTNEPDPVLPLTQGVHPLWLGKFRAFAQAAVAPALGVEKAETLSRDDWAAVKAKFAPYAAWLGAKAGAVVEGVGDEALAALVKDGKMQAAVNDLIQKDLALADEYARLVDCSRALRYASNLATWLCNYVNQANLYDYGHALHRRPRVQPLLPRGGRGRACRARREVQVLPPLRETYAQGDGRDARGVRGRHGRTHGAALRWPQRHLLRLRRQRLGRGCREGRRVAGVPEGGLLGAMGEDRQHDRRAVQEVPLVEAGRGSRPGGHARGRGGSGCSNPAARTARPRAERRGDRELRGGARRGRGHGRRRVRGARGPRRGSAAVEDRRRHRRHHPHRVAAERDPHVVQAPRARLGRDSQRLRLGGEPSALFLDWACAHVHASRRASDGGGRGARPLREGRLVEGSADARPDRRHRPRRVLEVQGLAVLLPGEGVCGGEGRMCATGGS